MLGTAIPAHAREQESKASVQTTSPSAQFEALRQEYSDAQDALSKATHLLPETEQAKYYEAHRPELDAYEKRFLALAEANPKTAVAAQALLWVLQNTSQKQSGYEAFETLIEDHGASAETGRACLVVRYDPSGKVAELLERARKKSTSPAVRGKATYALAHYWLLASERLEASEAHGTRTNRADIVKRADALFEEVTTTYANEEFSGKRTLGDAAQAALFEMRNLAIGKVAPDIEGEDLDGVKFKLSDYRGKVLVLDFWGNW
jgi:sulfite reductase alpha subunit-like flavoprotein